MQKCGNKIQKQQAKAKFDMKKIKNFFFTRILKNIINE